MNLKEDKIIKIALSFAIIVIAISVSYYFVWFLPKENKKKNDVEVELKRYELNSKMSADEEKQKEDAISVRDLCIKEASDYWSSFGLIHVNGAVRTGFDLSAFDDDASIYTALKGYNKCLEASPKYNNNSSIKLLSKQVNVSIARMKVTLAFYKSKAELDCNTEALIVRSRDICQGLNYGSSLEEYVKLAVENNDYKNIEEAKSDIENRLNDWLNSKTVQ